jgi:Lon protease-like protein
MKGGQTKPFRQFKKEWLEKREDREMKEVNRRVEEELDEDESDIDGHKTG